MYAGRARMLVERSLMVNRRAWLSVVSGFFEPLFYLVAMGVGFGRLTGDVTGPGGQTDQLRRPSSPRRCSRRRR